MRDSELARECDRVRRFITDIIRCTHGERSDIRANRRCCPADKTRVNSTAEQRTDWHVGMQTYSYGLTKNLFSLVDCVLKGHFPVVRHRRERPVGTEIQMRSIPLNYVTRRHFFHASKYASLISNKPKLKEFR